MEQSRGRIIAVADDQSHATVEVDTAVSCARCATGKGCGAGLFGSDRGPRQFDAPVARQMHLCAGDEVQIELAPQRVLYAALVVYGAPLAGVLIVSAMAYLVGFSDGAAAISVVFGVMLGALISRRRLQRSSCLRQLTPTITQRLAGAD